MKLEFYPTARGFLRADFTDLYDVECSIQESSLATDNAIWLGRIGWYEEPPWKRWYWMHLNREQVAMLIPVLEYFVENGHLPKELQDVKP